MENETEVVESTEPIETEILSDSEQDQVILVEIPSNEGFDSSDIVSSDIVRSVNPVTPNEANGLKKIMLQLIGDYDMVTSEYTYTSSNGYTSKQVTTEPDYSWMFSCFIFIIVLYSLFRFVGGLVNGKR